MKAIFILMLCVYASVNADGFVKKRVETYFYTPYTDLLENDRGIGSADFKYEFGGQISYDLAYVDAPPLKYTDSEFRRIRINNKGSFLDESIFYQLEYSFTGDNHYKDIYIGYKDKIKPIKLNYSVKAGNIKVPFSLESYSSSTNITFMERALMDTFAENRKLGAELHLYKKKKKHHLNLFTAILSSSIDERLQDDITKKMLASRATYAYKFKKNHLLSLGASFLYQDVNDDQVRYKQEAESHLIHDAYVSVRVKDVDRLSSYGAEALYINKSFAVQSEYIGSRIEALKDNYYFYGYYVQGSYLISGENKKYKLKKTTLSKIKPNNSYGGIEVAMRYSFIDLDDKDEAGGRQEDFTFGLNWYITSDLKWMTNYIIAKPESDRYDGLLQVLQTRILYAF